MPVETKTYIDTYLLRKKLIIVILIFNQNKKMQMKFFYI